MQKKFKKVTETIKEFALRHSNIIAAITFAIVVMDCNSNCAYVIGQPKLPEECNKFKKYA